MASYQLLLNQVLLDDHQDMSSQFGFHSQPCPSSLPDCSFLPFGYTQHQSLSLSSSDLKHKDVTSHLDGFEQAPSVPRSTTNPWPWGEGGHNSFIGSKRYGGDSNNHLGVSSVKMKKMKARRKVREPRFCFKTMSDVDVLDDGYKWRKYGQKVVKNTQHPRSYYRCTQDNCQVKKRVERLADDPRMVITTYEGRHAHSPSPDVDNSLQINNFFW